MRSQKDPEQQFPGCKDSSDERNLVITLTKAGEELKDRALCVPESIAGEFRLTLEEAMELYRILYKMLDQEREKNSEGKTG